MLMFGRVGLFLIGVILIAIEFVLAQRPGSRPLSIAAWVIGALLGTHILFNLFLWYNHAAFPLNLDLMEGTVLQHARQAATFQPIYPEPSAAYVPLAYNTLYYLATAPLVNLPGNDMIALRIFSIAGMAGSALLVFLLVRHHTQSAVWSLVAIGLFAAAYRTMDAYLDTAHSDSWFLFTALLGTYLLVLDRGRRWNLAAIVILVASFWFKQHGALFTVGGVVALTWREGLRRSWPYWMVAALLGPGLYLLGPMVLGPRFHFFTLEVPRAWSELSLRGLLRYSSFAIFNYGVLAILGGWFSLHALVRHPPAPDVLAVQFCAALFTGLLGTLDPGSSDNVYIPMGTFFIISGTIGLQRLTQQYTVVSRYRLHLLALFASLALLLYNPLNVITSTRAATSYADLVTTLKSLDGPAYLPSVGQLAYDYETYPAAHWVALEDMVRGPGKVVADHPLVRTILLPSLEPGGPAYILANYPLETYEVTAFLNDYYVLKTDFGDRFKPLRVLPKRWDHGWPRFLYRYDPLAAQAMQR